MTETNMLPSVEAMVEPKVRDHHKPHLNTNQNKYRSLKTCARSSTTISNGKIHNGLSVITIEMLSLINGLWSLALLYCSSNTALSVFLEILQNFYHNIKFIYQLDTSVWMHLILMHSDPYIMFFKIIRFLHQNQTF